MNPGSAHAHAQPHPVAQIVITIFSNGSFQLQGPDDPILLFGAIEMAKDGFKEQLKKRLQGPSIESPTPAQTNLLGKKIGE